MTEILTESFCERCGTRYTFESAVPSQRRLTGLKVLGRGLKNFVMSDDASLDEAMSAARSDVDRDATNHQLDAFHRTFSFCMSCRQYTCANCWNETEARCLSCEPLAIDFASTEALPDIDIDPARLLRLMGGANGADPAHEHIEPVAPAEHEHEHEHSQAEAPSFAMSEQLAGQTEAPAEHEDAEEPAAVVQDPWPTTPAAPVSWPEGFVGSTALENEPEAALTTGPEAVDEPAPELATALAEVPTDTAPDTTPVEWWARSEVLAEDQPVAAIEVPDAPATSLEPIAAEVEGVASREVEVGEPMAVEPMAVAPEAVAEPQIAAAEPIAAEAEAEAVAVAMAEPEVAAAESIAAAATLSDALAEYEAAFSAPIPAPEMVEASIVQPVEDRSQAAAEESPVAASLIPVPEALPEPVFSEPEPRAVVEVAPAAAPAAATPAAEPSDATPAAETVESAVPEEPVAAALPATPETPEAPTAEPAGATDHVAQPVWRAPADPASPAPQWPTGPRWPTGLPTGGTPSSLPPPVDALAALMARNSTEAMWAASSLEILQPASAAPTIAAIQSCGNCGISLSATARFCRRCGTPQV